MPPLVSVIMICRNGKRFLAEAIDSLFNQTLPDWELVFVDDGSTDGSLQLASAYALRDPARVRLIVHPGAGWRGTAASRNLGLLAARSEYVSFLDADDVYEAGRLGTHLRYLQSNPGLGLVISRDLYWRSWCHAGRRDFDAVIGPLAVTELPMAPPGLLVGTLLTPGAPLPGLGSVTFRRSALSRRIPQDFVGHYEDQVLLASAMLRESCIVLDEVLYRYRQHPWSLTRGNDPATYGTGSAAAMARNHFLVWLRRELAEISRPLPELEAWIDGELRHLHNDHSTRMSARFLGIASALGRLSWMGARWSRSRHRREVMGHIQRLTNASPWASARAYWDLRVQDLALSDDPVGTSGFIQAHDEYRHRKATYLEGLMQYDRWRDSAVLDVGCGIGLDLIRFARAGAKVTGLDLSTTAVEIARKNCAAAGVQATLLQGDAASLPFRDESFDLVTAYALIPFVPNPRAVINEMRRVLKPGGTAILMTYNRRSWMGLLAPLLGGYGGHADAPFYRPEAPGSWSRLCADFAEVQAWTDRFPARVPGGHAGTLILAAIWRLIPDPVAKNLGWHLLAVARKAE